MPTPTPTATAIGTTYYVDDVAGNDSNSGLDTAHPWQTVGKVNAQNQAGKTFKFKRGGTWNAELVLNTANTTRVDAYGTGAKPIFDTGQVSDCIELANAQNTTVANLQTQNCKYAGIIVDGASTSNATIDTVYTTANIAGIRLDGSTSASTYTRVINSQIINNNRMSVDTPCPPSCNDDSGAFGVLANGGLLWMENNDCNGQDAESYDYGRDGACVEFYANGGGSGGTGSMVRHNRAHDNDAFSEARGSGGGNPVPNLTYVQNHIYGAGAHAVGINVSGTGHIVNGNTIWLPTDGDHGPITDVNRGAQGIVGGSTGWTLRNNIVKGGWKAMYTGAAPSSEGYNDLVGLVQGFVLAATDITTDPLIVSATDRHLQASSPAIDAGDPAALESYVARTDMDGDTIPRDGHCTGVAVRDIGVDEYSGGC